MQPSAELNDILKHGGIPELQGNPEKFKDLRGEMRELCRTNLYFLGKAVMGWEDLTPRIHWPMCHFIQNPPARLTLLMGFRGSLKSTLGTIGRSIQLQLRRPCKIMIFSEGSVMADDFSRKARTPFEGGNPLFSWLFPELQGGQKTSSKWGDSLWVLPHGGYVQAAGVDSNIMGSHVNHLLMDDVFSDAKRDATPEYADRMKAWVSMSLPLLVNPAKDYRYLIGVPWWVGEGEPYSYYRQHLPREHQFVLPFELPDGSYTWPERIPPNELEDLKRDPFMYASQYLLNPVSADTAVFSHEVIKTYADKPPERNYFRIAALDPAFSEKRRGHHSALAVADVDAKGNIWIEHALKKKAESPEIIRWAIETCVKLGVKHLGVEANGVQIAFFQQVKRFRDQFPLYHPARAIQLVELRPVTDKIARWNQLSSGLGNGQVRIHERLRGSLISEMYRVTGAKHEENDLTDAAAHLVGPELSRRKPIRLTDQSPDAWLPWALREDREERPPPSFMAQ